jgi:hypothetical protein
MKVFGHVKTLNHPESLVELSEVTFQASPESLRTVASFLVKAAEDLERKGASFGHRHIQDEAKGWFNIQPEPPDVIVSV